VRDHRRTLRRKPTEALPEVVVDARGEGPMETAARREAAKVLHQVLDELDEDKRAAFILSELEQMTAPEISAALGVNLNTVYSRVRAARREFEQSVARYRAKDGWRGR
jgi:RNA polymerase sigma-70 factor (ECF subfamily)